MSKTYIFFFIFMLHNIYAKPQYLIVHGTWARASSWYMPGGDFYESLSNEASNSTISFFHWSGSNSHAARVEAAQQLANYIDINIPANQELNIIAHSHGSNVVLLASYMIANNPENNYRIHRLYSLGAPIHMQAYAPNMSTIHYLYNLFSFSDMIQTVFGSFAREFPLHERIANLVVTIDGKEPTHSNLHSPLIARWIPYIPDKLCGERIGNFEQFSYTQPGILHFSSNYAPVYANDTERAERKKRDIEMLLYLSDIMRRKNITH